MAQYFGTEGDLHGSVRKLRPWLIYMYDSALNDWHVADLHPRGHQQSSLVPEVLAAFQRSQAENPSYNADIVGKAEKIISVLSIIEN